MYVIVFASFLFFWLIICFIKLEIEISNYFILKFILRHDMNALTEEETFTLVPKTGLVTSFITTYHRIIPFTIVIFY